MVRYVQQRLNCNWRWSNKFVQNSWERRPLFNYVGNKFLDSEIIREKEKEDLNFSATSKEAFMFIGIFLKLCCDIMRYGFDLWVLDLQRY